MYCSGFGIGGGSLAGLKKPISKMATINNMVFHLSNSERNTTNSNHSLLIINFYVKIIFHRQITK